MAGLGTVTNVGDVVAFPSGDILGMYGSLFVTLIGTGITGGSVVFEVLAPDGATWLSCPMSPLGGGTGVGTATFTAGSIAQMWVGEVAEASSFRVRCTANLGAALSVWMKGSDRGFR